MMRAQYKTYLHEVEKYLKKSGSMSEQQLLFLPVIVQKCHRIGDDTFQLEEMRNQACSDTDSVSEVTRRY
jgi:hypothetical protein